jgi:hypothetical protein
MPKYDLNVIIRKPRPPFEGGGAGREDLPLMYDGRDGSLEQTDADREFTRGTDWENA